MAVALHLRRRRAAPWPLHCSFSIDHLRCSSVVPPCAAARSLNCSPTAHRRGSPRPRLTAPNPPQQICSAGGREREAAVLHPLASLVTGGVSMLRRRWRYWGMRERRSSCWEDKVERAPVVPASGARRPYAREGAERKRGGDDNSDRGRRRRKRKKKICGC